MYPPYVSVIYKLFNVAVMPSPLLDGSTEDNAGGATIEGAKATTERVGDGLILCIYINTM